MKINHDILARAKAAVAEEDYIDTCLRAKLCPKCGEKLDSGTKSDGHGGFKDWYRCSGSNSNPLCTYIGYRW